MAVTTTVLGRRMPETNKGSYPFAKTFEFCHRLSPVIDLGYTVLSDILDFMDEQHSSHSRMRLFNFTESLSKKILRSTTKSTRVVAGAWFATQRRNTVSLQRALYRRSGPKHVKKDHSLRSCDTWTTLQLETICSFAYIGNNQIE
jgi:hypothetical protein